MVRYLHGQTLHRRSEYCVLKRQTHHSRPIKMYILVPTDLLLTFFFSDVNSSALLFALIKIVKPPNLL